MNASPIYPTAARQLGFAYLFGIVLCSLILSASLFVEEAGASACKTILALLVLLTLVRGAGVILLLATQLYLFLREPIESGYYLRDVVLVSVTSLTLVMLCQRFRLLLQLQGISSLSDFRALLVGRRQSASPASRSSAGRRTVWKGPLATIIASSLSCVCLAALALAMIPADERAPQRVGLMPSALRVIELGCVLTTTCVIVTIFVRELEWRRMSPRTAALFTQSVLLEWISRDLRMISKRRIKFQQRSAGTARFKAQTTREKG